MKVDLCRIRIYITIFLTGFKDVVKKKLYVYSQEPQ
jgi:hypothetical protein